MAIDICVEHMLHKEISVLVFREIDWVLSVDIKTLQTGLSITKLPIENVLSVYCAA